MDVRTSIGQTALEPAVPILVLAGAVQVYRAYPVDIALYFGTAALIMVDGYRWRGVQVSAEPVPGTGRSTGTVAGIAIAFGLVVGLIPRDSGWLDLVLALPGIAVLYVVLRPARTAGGAGRCAAPPSPPRWAVWPALGVALALIELFSFLSQPDARTDSYQHPTVSTTVEPLLDAEPVRMLSLALWFAIGWWLVRRVVAWQSRA